MVRGRKLRPVKPIAKYQQDLLNQAGETIAGAQAAKTVSAKVAFNAAYDAMRFTVDLISTPTACASSPARAATPIGSPMPGWL